jgi:hypothetical protein
MKCPVCKKEFDEYTGRRAKKFCSDDCKVKFWNAFKKVGQNNKPKNKVAIEAERETVSDKPNAVYPLTEKECQVAEYEKELAGLGTSGLAVMRKKFLLKQIQLLKTKPLTV